MIKLIREFSSYGPCLTIGRFVRETKHFYVYNQWRGGDSFDTADKRIGKGRRVHTEPCSSCCDHPRTHYPHGYMD